jgi:hypothetical protein
MGVRYEVYFIIINEKNRTISVYRGTLYERPWHSMIVVCGSTLISITIFLNLLECSVCSYKMLAILKIIFFLIQNKNKTNRKKSIDFQKKVKFVIIVLINFLQKIIYRLYQHWKRK